MKPFLLWALFLVLTVASNTVLMVVMAHETPPSRFPLTRSKRGLTDFFKRFWNIRKKITYFPFQQSSSSSSSSPSSVVPMAAAGLSPQDYSLLSQASNFYPLYQMNQAYGFSPYQQQQQQYQQYLAAAAAAAAAAAGEPPSSSIQPPPPQPNQQSDQQPGQHGYQQQQTQSHHPGGHGYHQHHHHQHRDHPSGGTSNTYNYPPNSGGGPGGDSGRDESGSGSYQSQSQRQYESYQNQPLQADESRPKPSYYYPPAGGTGSFGVDPYTFHQNPSQANAFNSRPYGSHPGTLDVHQVLDQFIRSAGLSPQGDHDSAKSYGGDSDKALSVKKLYSYPFYFTSSGDRPTSIRRQSNDELPPPPPLVKRPPPPLSTYKKPNNQVLPVSVSAKPTLPPSSAAAAAITEDEESSFIAKNAAALQEFLASTKQQPEVSKSESAP